MIEVRVHPPTGTVRIYMDVEDALELTTFLEGSGANSGVSSELRDKLHKALTTRKDDDDH